MNMQHLDQCPPRLQRLKMRMMRYLLQVIYVPGKELTIADTLSRSPVDKSDVTLGAAIEEHVDSITSVWPVSGFMQNKLREETSRDPQLSRLLKILQTHWPKAMHQLDVDLRQFWNARHLLTEVNGIVLRGSQIVIPKCLRRDMIQRAHEGHLGIAKTKCRAREVIWWPGMGAQLETVVANCNVCARYRREQRRGPLQVSTLPERPWQRVAAELFQLRDVHYLLVVDYYSRFPEVHRLSDLYSNRIVDGLEQVFSRHGIPSELHTDNGPQFASDEFRQFARDYGFHHTTSSPHHPQGNGLVERSVQTIKGLLRKSAETGGDFYLALLAFRACPLEATTLSPAQLLMGRRLRTTLPSVPSVLQPELASTPTLRAKDAEKKQQQADHYNKRHGARVLQTLTLYMPYVDMRMTDSDISLFLSCCK